ncbi:hypothetical protein [Kitasatospora cathayae]|uniref:Uncharacterized protein n=1 Tax=Kitasatospora cathayae TaxID=3004092 RepID=A0ABY7QFF1_9ACTN|nr:hypothetical protein [Kitasatospora sp. HUAS 3-15]WBP90969.1 hypothetical protein O1G21_37265 [Kitasatospora sp. HUAS 3-15]
MNVHMDLLLAARVRLMSHNDRILTGEEGMRAYRILFTVSPRAYAYKLAYVLRELSESGARVARLPQARQALLEEAQAASTLIPADAPAYQRHMWDHTMAQLREIERRLGQAGQ